MRSQKFQKNRNNIPDYYGLRESTYYKNIQIVRPLLSVDKISIYKYLNSSKINFGVDKTNFELIMIEIL